MTRLAKLKVGQVYQLDSQISFIDADVSIFDDDVFEIVDLKDGDLIMYLEVKKIKFSGKSGLYHIFLNVKTQKKILNAADSFVNWYGYCLKPLTT